MFNSLQDSPEPQNSNNNRITSAPVQGRHLLQQTSGKDGAAAGAASNSGSIKVRERKFENGDRYRGGWLSGLVSTGCDAGGLREEVGDLKQHAAVPAGGMS